MITATDRKNPPKFKTIEKVEIIKATKKTLKNNLPVYTINAGTEELVRIEFIFPAGKRNEPFPLVAKTVNSMLDEGTSKYSASEIANKIDYYGAFLETDITQDFAFVSLYTLNKHLANTLPVVEELIKDAIFPADELAIYLKNSKQDFLVNDKKVNHVARKKFNELIFGGNNPYGYNVKIEDFDNLNRDYLVDFHAKYYSSNSCMIIVSGKVNDAIIDLINKHFGEKDWSVQEDAISNTLSINSNAEKKHLIYKDDAVQSAIRIGRAMFNKTHPDYIPMKLLNTVLGGYFGSRLMNNIREDKGYTYGIGSGIVSLQQSGYFFISTEVGVDVCSKAIDEVYFELKRLREDLIEKEELTLVKNYMLGAFLRSVDGPFALAEKFKGIIEYNLDYDYYDKYIAKIKNTTAVELRELANEYFQQDSLYELVVGKK